MNVFQVWVIVFATVFACWTIYNVATSIEKASSNLQLACAIVCAILYGITMWIVYLGGFFGSVQ